MARKTNLETGLTDKQERICREYLKDFNGTQAAIRAGYPEASAGQQAHEVLSKPEAQSFLQRLAAKRNEKVDVKSEDVLREMTRMGYSDVRGLFDENHVIKPMSEWPEDLARAVASIETEELFEGHGKDRVWTGYVNKVKLWNKNHAVEMLAKNQKLLTDRHEHSGPGGGPIRVSAQNLSDEELQKEIEDAAAKAGFRPAKTD